ncbi:M24 family metallopeptidase [Selenihalanaerobacter shriftii]|uniref:Xaa-Pro aminopeptidase n=1 Tax=Selenihalanaerobacter shriftii TaxID=142842 RepID=A0A1T4P4Q5_9FIRM|nr:Xaa-Pro peptidase family protein [Selenihalanaerobacter shriftii]SJZ85908.1 Xaa-Pro aminopeptidase [Selenihalanaerobacter shriftii]
MEGRIKLVRNKLDELNLDGIMINNPQNRYYMTGFTGTAGTILITKKTAKIITDFRYTEQAKEQAVDYEIVEHGNSKLETLSEELKDLEINRLGFEAAYETYKQYNKYQDKFGFLELVSTKGLVEELRKIKDASEIKEVKKAVKIADQAFDHILDYIEPGLTEREVSLELEYFMKKQGATDNAFDFIVASGKRGVLPHGVATDKELEAGDMLTLDLGCVYRGYNSDLTRTIIIGAEPTEKQEEVYQIVLKAQLAAIDAIKPGKTGAEVDKIAREIITKAGYGENFGHGLGHGVGLQVHEEPRLAKTGKTKLESGMIVTVEPGIYLPDWGGVRIEDIVEVTIDGCRILTEASKELIRV